MQQCLSQALRSDVTAAICIRMTAFSCRSASCFLQSQCFNRCLYTWTWPVLLFVCYMTLWIINEGDASLQTHEETKTEPGIETDTNEHVRGLSAGSHANT